VPCPFEILAETLICLILSHTQITPVHYRKWQMFLYYGIGEQVSHLVGGRSDTPSHLMLQKSIASLLCQWWLQTSPSRPFTDIVNCFCPSRRANSEKIKCYFGFFSALWRSFKILVHYKQGIKKVSPKDKRGLLVPHAHNSSASF
jgi:hypothetical protein